MMAALQALFLKAWCAAPSATIGALLARLGLGKHREDAYGKRP